MIGIDKYPFKNGLRVGTLIVLFIPIYYSTSHSYYLFFLGTRLLYLLVRDKLGIKFSDGQTPQDTNLQKLFDALKDGLFDDILVKLASMAKV